MKKLITLSFALLLCLLGMQAVVHRVSLQPADSSGTGNGITMKAAMRNAAIESYGAVSFGFGDAGQQDAVMRTPNMWGYDTKCQILVGRWRDSQDLCTLNLDDGVMTRGVFYNWLKFTVIGAQGNKIFGFGYDTNGGNHGSFCVYDMSATDPDDNNYWVKLQQTDFTDNFDSDFIMHGVYVPAENAFYGSTSDGSWIKYDVVTGNTTRLGETTVNDVDYAYNIHTGKLVGISQDGKLKEYDLTTGAEGTLLTTITKTATGTSGFGYDPSSKCYIYTPYNPNSSTIRGKAFAINSETLNVSTAGMVQGTKSQVGSICFVMAADAAAPMPAEYVGAEFLNGARTGTVTFRLPAVLDNASEITGNVDYVLSVNGNEYFNGSGAAGSDAVLAIGEDANLADGNNIFSLICTVDTQNSPECTKELWIGNDNPLAPENVTVLPGYVSWNAVTSGTGIHGGYVDVSAITYTVKINGVLVADGISTTSCTAEFPSGIVKAEVTAHCNGLDSEPAFSVDTDLPDNCFSEPCGFAPTADQMSLFTFINANNDDREWKYTDNGLQIVNSTEIDADDWIILPGIVITDTEHLHKFSMIAFNSGLMPERFEVKVGTAPTVEAMTQTVIPETIVQDVNWSENKVFDGNFTINEGGIYYIGIHCTSTPKGYYFTVRDFKVRVTEESVNGPKSVTGLAVTAADKGGLNATVTFTLPAETNRGEVITGNIKAVVSSKADTKEVEGAPGSEQTVVIGTLQGDNVITVQPLLSGIPGESSVIEVYTGVDVPLAPASARIDMNANNVSGTLRWEAPVIGANGGYVSPTGVTYYLCLQKWNPRTSRYEWDIAGELGTDVHEYEFDLGELSSQQGVQYGVLAENAAGRGKMVRSAMAAVGKPYNLPVNETYESDEKEGEFVMHYTPLCGDGIDQLDSDKSVLWQFGYINQAFSSDYYSPDGVGVWCKAYHETTGWMDLPKFTTKGQTNIRFTPSFYVGSTKSIRMTVRSFDTEEVEIFNLENAQGITQNAYNTIDIDLPAEFEDKAWVQIRLYADFTYDTPIFIIDGYKIVTVGNDMSAKLTGDLTSFVGLPSTFKATVTNVGAQPMTFSGGKFTVCDDFGNVIAEHTSSYKENILSTEHFVDNWDYVPQIDHLGEIVVTYQLFADDENALNNTSDITGNVVKGNAIVAENLVATPAENGVDLAWNDASTVSGHESFENLLAFELSSSRVGEFTQVVNSTAPVYMWTMSRPEELQLLMKVAYLPGFNVYGVSELNEAIASEGFAEADGNQFIMAFCPMSQTGISAAAADDWLISPVLEGGSTFTFQAAPAVTNQFGQETIEIWYSTEDTADTSEYTFAKSVNVGSTNPQAPLEWQTVSYQLPAGACRVAVRYVSQNVFGIKLDDFNYTPKGGKLSITGYNIYRADDDAETFEKIGSATECTFPDTSVDRSVVNRYYVKPALSDGSEGLRSNIAFVETAGIGSVSSFGSICGGKGIITICGFAGEQVSVYAPDGKNVAAGVATDSYTMSVDPGIYIVKAGKRIAKIIVF